MGSKLKKKAKLKPDGYEKRNAIHNHRKNARLSEKCFMELFYSMQLVNFTVLYMAKEDGGFDFSKKRLQNFNRILTKHNQAYDDGGFISTAVSQEHKKKLGFDCYKEAKNFPYRPKMKMYGGKPKTMQEHNIALTSINGAIETVEELQALKEKAKPKKKCPLWGASFNRYG